MPASQVGGGGLIAQRFRGTSGRTQRGLRPRELFSPLFVGVLRSWLLRYSVGRISAQSPVGGHCEYVAAGRNNV